MSDPHNKPEQTEENQPVRLRLKSESAQGKARPFKEPENKPEAPVRIRCAESSESSPESSPAFKEITADSHARELHQVLYDYKIGRSSCTATMNYDDYERLGSWLRTKPYYEFNGPLFKDAETECLSIAVIDGDYYHFDGKKQSLEESCREFEQGDDRILVFPEGLRGVEPVTHILSKESSLAELKETALRCSDKYEGAVPLAALPEKKRILLDDWIKDRERLKFSETPQQREHDDRKRMHGLLQEITLLSAYPDSRYATVRAQEARETLKQTLSAKPHIAERVLDYLQMETQWLDAQTREFKELSRTLPKEPLKDSPKQKQENQWLIDALAEIKKDNQQALDNLIQLNPENKSLRLIKEEEKEIQTLSKQTKDAVNKETTQTHQSQTKTKAETQIKGDVEEITIQKDRYHFYSYSKFDRSEDLIMLRQAAKNGEQKLSKEQLAALDKWIDNKKQNVASRQQNKKELDNKQKQETFKVQETAYRPLPASPTKTKPLAKPVPAKSLAKPIPAAPLAKPIPAAPLTKPIRASLLKTSPLPNLIPPPPAPPPPPPPAANGVTFEICSANEATQSISGSTRAEAVAKLQARLSAYAIAPAQRSSVIAWASNAGPKPGSIRFQASGPARLPSRPDMPPGRSAPPPPPPPQNRERDKQKEKDKDRGFSL